MTSNDGDDGAAGRAAATSEPDSAAGGRVAATGEPDSGAAGRAAATSESVSSAGGRVAATGEPDSGAAGRSRYPRPSSEGRSANMRANRRTNTKPEVALRSALHRLGYRYRKDHRLDLGDADTGTGRVRVRPDIVFTARKVAVFVDGCFWHACPEHGRQPKVNEWYWTPKLRRNVERDRAADTALTAAGWQVVRLWEHVSLAAAVDTVVAAVGERRRSAAGDKTALPPVEAQNVP